MFIGIPMVHRHNASSNTRSGFGWGWAQLEPALQVKGESERPNAKLPYPIETVYGIPTIRSLKIE